MLKNKILVIILINIFLVIDCKPKDTSDGDDNDVEEIEDSETEENTSDEDDIPLLTEKNQKELISNELKNEFGESNLIKLIYKKNYKEALKYLNKALEFLQKNEELIKNDEIEYINSGFKQIFLEFIAEKDFKQINQLFSDLKKDNKTFEVINNSKFNFNFLTDLIKNLIALEKYDIAKNIFSDIIDAQKYGDWGHKAKEIIDEIPLNKIIIDLNEIYINKIKKVKDFDLEIFEKYEILYSRVIKKDEFKYIGSLKEIIIYVLKNLKNEEDKKIQLIIESSKKLIQNNDNQKIAKILIDMLDYLPIDKIDTNKSKELILFIKSINEIQDQLNKNQNDKLNKLNKISK